MEGQTGSGGRVRGQAVCEEDQGNQEGKWDPWEGSGGRWHLWAEIVGIGWVGKVHRHRGSGVRGQEASMGGISRISGIHREIGGSMWQAASAGGLLGSRRVWQDQRCL